MSNEIDTPDQSGLSRRDVLRRGAVVGGALVWTTPLVQSLAGPAFAQAVPSRRIDENCDEIFQFKMDGTFTTFSNGAAPDCVPTGYNKDALNFVSPSGVIPNNHGTIRISVQGRTATITIPSSCTLLDGQAKAGSINGANLECEDATPVLNSPGVYTVTLPTKDISFVAGVICC